MDTPTAPEALRDATAYWLDRNRARVIEAVEDAVAVWLSEYHDALLEVMADRVERWLQQNKTEFGQGLAGQRTEEE